MRARNILLLIAAGLASAALAYLGTGLHPLWWALWLAPVPVLAVAPRLRRSVAFLLASLAWLIGELNQLAYFRHGIELSLPVIIILLVIPAAVFGLGVLFARAFLRQGLSFWLRWPSLLPGSHTNTSAKLVRPTAHSGISPTPRWIVCPSSRSRVSPAFRESAFSCFFLPVARRFLVGAEIVAAIALSPSLSASSLASYFFLANGGCRKSSCSICRDHTRRQGRADECLSRFRKSRR